MAMAVVRSAIANTRCVVVDDVTTDVTDVATTTHFAVISYCNVLCRRPVRTSHLGVIKYDYDIERTNCDLVLRKRDDNKLCYRATCYVKVFSTAETSCTTTNSQQIAIMELEGYSWSTCSKQPRLVDYRRPYRCRQENKLDRRRRRRRVLLTTRSTCSGEIFCVRNLVQNSRGKHSNFWRYPNFLTIQYAICGRKLARQKPTRLVQSFWYNTSLWRTDGQTDGHTTACSALE